MRPVSSWGLLSADLHEVVSLSDPGKVPRQIQARASKVGIAYGMGRSYGDVCLNPCGTVWTTIDLDRFIAFDETNGRLVCEAGVLLRDIQHLVIPRGWILPVTPGTQWITVGGAIANDVHGKNHHRQGSFGEHLQRIRLIRTDGEVIECSPTLRPDWFAATVGGLGLTGVIVEAEIQLQRVTGPWLDTETLPYWNLEEFFQLSDASEAEWEHTVSWVDCISGDRGRGLFMRGKPTEPTDRAAPKNHRFTFPIMPPVSLVNQVSLRLFNSAYFHTKKRRTDRRPMYYESFLYPLDNLLKWNRMYGKKGFYQYQCVVPDGVGKGAIRVLLGEISRSGEGSFLTVLKKFGSRPSLGMLSFVMPGVTLALDFPNQGDRTLKLFERLDAIVYEAGGRIYPAKDSRMPRALFEAGYPRLNEFLKYRDPGISSGLSRRLMGF